MNWTHTFAYNASHMGWRPALQLLIRVKGGRLLCATGLHDRENFGPGIYWRCRRLRCQWWSRKP